MADGMSEQLRIDSQWVLDNRPDCQAHLKQIEENEPSRLQVLGVRGLRERVENERRSGVRNRQLNPTRRGPTPTQQLQARIDELELAMVMSGLAFEAQGGTFVVGNRRSHMVWRNRVDNWQEGSKPDDTEPNPSSRTAPAPSPTATSRSDPWPIRSTPSPAGAAAPDPLQTSANRRKVPGPSVGLHVAVGPKHNAQPSGSHSVPALVASACAASPPDSVKASR